MKLLKVDHEHRLYSIHSGPGYSCYGFEVLDRQARAVGAWLAEQTDNPAAADAARMWLGMLGEPGNGEHFQVCANILERAQIHCGVFHRRDLHGMAPVPRRAAQRPLARWRCARCWRYDR